jgi:hypothetical protein
MKTYFYILFLALFFLASGRKAVASVNDTILEVKVRKTETSSDTKSSDDAVQKDDKQKKKDGASSGSVKQVKSARPDMSKSRGARPPDIVRPSGSRIPKGVGRPAGAARHGH